MRKLILYIFFISYLFLASNPLLSKESKDSSVENIDVKNIVFSHIIDSYQWHITKLGDKDITIPLPIIVISNENGLNIFLSSRICNGDTYNGFYISTQGKYKGKVVEKVVDGVEKRPIDISITKSAFALIINSLILILLFLYIRMWYIKKPDSAPGGLVGFIEIIVTDINDNVIKSCIGKDYEKYAPYLLTAFFFIFINNIMGLIPLFPAGANTTGNIAITLVLAICTFLAVNLSGTKEYWKEVFWPDVPLWMKLPVPLMPIIELFSVLTKPFALMIRLFANVMAGHAIILGLMSIIFVTVAMGPGINAGMSLISIALSVFMSLLEILVAYIQAYVFTMLSAVFIGLAKVKSEKIINKI